MNGISKLLSTDGFIQVNKQLIKTLGLHEAIMLGELCAEYNYWQESGKLIDDMFYSTRQNLEENTGLNEHYQRKALETLKEAEIVEVVKKGIPATNYYKINFDKILTTLSTSPSRDEALEVNDMQINNNKIEKNKEKDIKTNSNKLELVQEEQEFEFGKPKAVKTNLYKKCIAMIYDFTDNKELQDLLITYLNMRLEIKDKPLYANQWKGMLRKLGSYSDYDRVLLDIVQQSIDRGYFGFFPVNNYSKQKQSTHEAIHESGSGVIEIDTKEDEAKREQFRNEMETKGKKATF